LGRIIVVGISELAITADPAASLATYALGSCIAVAMNDPAARVAGLLHFLLPDSAWDTARGQGNPCMYADRGIPLLLEQLLDAGASRQRLIVRAAGGANVLDDQGLFGIGKRNDASLRKTLTESGLALHAAAIGGSVARSVRLDAGSGRLWVREGVTTAWELPVEAQQSERSFR
jgi:chemotaxis protein CheD